MCIVLMHGCQGCVFHYRARYYESEKSLRLGNKKREKKREEKRSAGLYVFRNMDEWRHCAKGLRQNVPRSRSYFIT